MSLVLGICDRIIVLEFGKVIAEGAPEVVRRDPKVIAAYLGDSLESAATPGSAEETV
jgi:ABC-type branched-subunit amino acid transport system ATPase component